MADGIEQIAERLNRMIRDDSGVLATRLAAAGSIEGPHAERTLSNTSLLLESLATFYGDPKSEFFPAVINTTIRDRLIQAENTLVGMLPDQVIPADSATSFLKLLEDLYVYCLQYGLITYGFTSKTAGEQIELIRLARNNIEAVARKTLTVIKGHELELGRKREAFEESMTQAEATLKSRIAEQIDASKPTIERLADLLASGQSNATAIGSALKAVTEQLAAVGKVRTDLDTAAAAATAEFATRKATAEAELATIQALGLQVQKFESDAKTMHQAVTDTRAKMTDQMTQITAFYGEMETFRLQVTEAGKAAQTHLAELRDRSEKLVAELGNRTDKVVGENESLIGQIKDHLRKAIGASLFTAFDTRRKTISYASWVWAIVLLLSVSGTIGFAFWFVAEVVKITKDNPQDVPWAVIYARLIIVAPLAFLIAFSAKRYSSERRAEEEWAFKSAISISLDPFRDLIVRMKKDGHETAFVERLVAEIFDNPTKRLYGSTLASHEKDGLDVPELVKDLLDKIPKVK